MDLELVAPNTCQNPGFEEVILQQDALNSGSALVSQDGGDALLSEETFKGKSGPESDVQATITEENEDRRVKME